MQEVLILVSFILAAIIVASCSNSCRKLNGVSPISITECINVIIHLLYFQQCMCSFILLNCKYLLIHFILYKVTSVLMCKIRFFTNQYLKICLIYEMKTSNPLLLRGISSHGSLGSPVLQINRQTSRWLNQRSESSYYPAH